MVIIRRLMQYALVFFAIFTINFFLPRLAPGGPASVIAGEDYEFMTDEEIKGILKEYGLDRPILEQYGRYLRNLFTGKWGHSVLHSKPVWEVLIHDKAPWTLLIGLTAFIIGSLLSIILGVISSLRRGKKLDIGILSFTMLNSSIPAFWFAMLAITFFCAHLNFLPAYGAFDVTLEEGSREYYASIVEHMILPVSILVLAQIGGTYLTTRSSMASILEEDFIMFAKSKGIDRKAIIYRHAFPNAFLPVVTGLGISLGHLVGGATVIETVFAYPGLGNTIYNSVITRDYPMIQGAFLIISLSVVLANLAVDMIYPFLDPRIRKPGEES